MGKGKIDNAGPKYAFVDCDALKRQGYDKVFIMRDELKEYQVGQIVKFTAYLDSLGRLQGKNLKSGLNGTKNVSKQAKNVSKPVQVRDEEGGELGEYIGKIDNAGPKYAFIDCKQLKKDGHGKVFIMKADLK